MALDQPNTDKLRSAKEPHLIRDDAGTNPGGNRCIYDVIKRDNQACTLENLGYVGVFGSSSRMLNLHPQEASDRVTIPIERLLRDFILL